MNLGPMKPPGGMPGMPPAQNGPPGPPGSLAPPTNGVQVNKIIKLSCSRDIDLLIIVSLILLINYHSLDLKIVFLICIHGGRGLYIDCKLY